MNPNRRHYPLIKPILFHAVSVFVLDFKPNMYANLNRALQAIDYLRIFVGKASSSRTY